MAFMRFIAKLSHKISILKLGTRNDEKQRNNFNEKITFNKRLKHIILSDRKNIFIYFVFQILP